jgi:hypothetical protein
MKLAFTIVVLAGITYQVPASYLSMLLTTS